MGQCSISWPNSLYLEAAGQVILQEAGRVVLVLDLLQLPDRPPAYAPERFLRFGRVVEVDEGVEQSQQFGLCLDLCHRSLREGVYGLVVGRIQPGGRDKA